VNHPEGLLASGATLKKKIIAKGDSLVWKPLPAKDLSRCLHQKVQKQLEPSASFLL
jgi:hypothetical protein